MVLKAGLEPARLISQQILSLSRLPLRHSSLWRRVRDSNPKASYDHLISSQADYQLSQLSMAGVGGFKPPHRRFKAYCLIAWLHPNVRNKFILFLLHIYYIISFTSWQVILKI